MERMEMGFYIVLRKEKEEGTVMTGGTFLFDLETGFEK